MKIRYGRSVVSCGKIYWRRGTDYILSQDMRAVSPSPHLGLTPLHKNHNNIVCSQEEKVKCRAVRDCSLLICMRRIWEADYSSLGRDLRCIQSNEEIKGVWRQKNRRESVTANTHPVLHLPRHQPSLPLISPMSHGNPFLYQKKAPQHDMAALSFCTFP